MQMESCQYKVRTGDGRNPNNPGSDNARDLSSPRINQANPTPPEIEAQKTNSTAPDINTRISSLLLPSQSSETEDRDIAAASTYYTRHKNSEKTGCQGKFDTQTGFFVVYGVNAGSWAERVNIKNGDMICAVNGNKFDYSLGMDKREKIRLMQLLTPCEFRLKTGDGRSRL